MSECLNSESRKARKHHRCYFCGEAICIGDRYDYRCGTTSGELWAMHMHPECNEATHEWKEEDYETFSEGTMKRGIDAHK